MKIGIIAFLLLLIFQISFGQSSIEDADGDMKIDTESSADVDRIMFELGGTEHFLLQGYKIEILNSNWNVIIGENAGNVLSGSRNVAIGFNSLLAAENSDQNTAIGSRAGAGLTSGSQNVAIGEASLLANQTGDRNTAVGQSTLRGNMTGSNNVAIGEEALYNSLGSNNVAIGRRAGDNALDACVMIGFEAGRNETGSNKLYIENSNSSTPLIYGEFDNDLLVINGAYEVSSDIRLKEGIMPYQNVLRKITRLNAYGYKRKGIVDKERREIGLLAQEVLPLVPDAVSENRDGYLSVNYNAMIPLLIEAIKEQQKLIEELQAKID